MDSLHRLEEIFAHFPGIGPRQARRFVNYVLSRPPSFAKEFTYLIETIKRLAHECNKCHRFFIENGIKKTTCDICNDNSRDVSALMIVARDTDLESIEKSGAYRGLYFVLGGIVPILDKEPDKRIRLKELLERISDESKPKEIILSLNATPDGEHTTNIVKDAISKFIDTKETKVSILGRGLSTGSELEYADSDTIKNALKNRF
ncbi:MAG: toprim domain-containing protein [Candidatus Paceibacterota bacterium]|jgi:recombination protein RecR